MLRASFRRCIRFPWLGLELLRALVSCLPAVQSLRRKPRSGPAWLQRRCSRLLKVFNVELGVDGLVPSAGLLVSNHLSYLDILVIGAACPARFVSKREVRDWPLLGFLARQGGTLFIDRSRKSETIRLRRELRTSIVGGNLAVLFPEGTTTDGATVLPFKPGLLSAVEATDLPVSIAHLSYELEDGSVPKEVCYWGDMTLVPHLLNLLGKRRIRAALVLKPGPVGPLDRKSLARETHAEVRRIHDEPAARNHDAEMRCRNLPIPELSSIGLQPQH